MEHPCKGRCSEYKQESCVTCLIDQKQTPVIQLEALADQLESKSIDDCCIEVFGVAER